MRKLMRSKIAAAMVAVAVVCSSAATADANILSALNEFVTGVRGAIAAFQSEVRNDPEGARLTLGSTVLQLRMTLFERILTLFGGNNTATTTFRIR